MKQNHTQGHVLCAFNARKPGAGGVWCLRDLLSSLVGAEFAVQSEEAAYHIHRHREGGSRGCGHICQTLSEGMWDGGVWGGESHGVLQ